MCINLERINIGDEPKFEDFTFRGRYYGCGERQVPFDNYDYRDLTPKQAMVKFKKDIFQRELNFKNIHISCVVITPTRIFTDVTVYLNADDKGKFDPITVNYSVRGTGKYVKDQEKLREAVYPYLVFLNKNIKKFHKLYKIYKQDQFNLAVINSIEKENEHIKVSQERVKNLKKAVK